MRTHAIIFAAFVQAIICSMSWAQAAKQPEQKEVFADNPRLAGSVNHLLVVGFYLLNLGYALLTLKAGHDVATLAEAMETLAMKLGSLLLVLGAMHMTNLYIFHRMRRRGQIRLAPPPVRAQLQHNGVAIQPSV